jgi:peptidoglycan/xylan/chitin deacetylase (PgdA/CDA1 family)
MCLLLERFENGVNHMKKKFSVLLLAVLISGGFYFFWLSPRYTVPILMYHRIGDEQGSFSVSPKNFTRQMEFLKKFKYRVISLEELVRSIREKKYIPKNSVVITFDDGYRNNFIYAYPVLKKLNFPATVFLISDFIDTKPEFLKWNEIMVMSKANISFGGHTKTHYYLGIPKDEKVAFEEISGSKKAIEKMTGLPADYFCYPSGGFNQRVKELVAQAGYQGACTTNRGFADYNSDVYELKRIKVTNSDAANPLSFWAKLSGYYNLFRKEKNPY